MLNAALDRVAAYFRDWQIIAESAHRSARTWAARVPSDAWPGLVGLGVQRAGCRRASGSIAAATAQNDRGANGGRRPDQRPRDIRTQ